MNKHLMEIRAIDKLRLNNYTEYKEARKLICLCIHRLALEEIFDYKQELSLLIDVILSQGAEAYEELFHFFTGYFCPC